MSVCPFAPDSSDFGDVCALFAPFLHQLTMQSSLFERGCPVLVSRASYARVQATVGVGTVLIWDFGVAYTRGGGVQTSAGQSDEYSVAPSSVCSTQSTAPSLPCSWLLPHRIRCQASRHATDFRGGLATVMLQNTVMPQRRRFRYLATQWSPCHNIVFVRCMGVHDRCCGGVYPVLEKNQSLFPPVGILSKFPGCGY